MSSEQELVELFSREFPYPIDSFEGVSIGSNFTSIRVQSSGVEYFVKGVIAGDSISLERLKREERVLSEGQFFESFSVPTVIDEYFGGSDGVVVFSVVSGEPLNREMFRNGLDMAYSIGEALSNVHSFSSEGLLAGEYGVEGHGLVQETRKAIEDTQFKSYSNRVSDCELILSNTEPKCGLAHGDFHPPNILFDAEGLVSGIVDWEYSGESDVLLDVAKVEVRLFMLYESMFSQYGFEVEDLQTAFRDAYGFEEELERRVDAYKELYLLREGGLVEKYGELELWKSISTESTIAVCSDLLSED